jgi:hypothetical protein
VSRLFHAAGSEVDGGCCDCSCTGKVGVLCCMKSFDAQTFSAANMSNDGPAQALCHVVHN